MLLFVKQHITPFYLGDNVFKSKYDYFTKNEKNFNTVVFGSSRLYRQVNSLLLDSLLRDYKTSTFNFSAGGTYNPESYFLYERFIRTIDSGNIKIAFLELQQLHPYSSLNCQTTKASYWNNEDFLLYSFKYINSSTYSKEKKKNMYSSYFKSYIYSFFDFSFIKNVFVKTNENVIGENGFYPLEKAMAESTEDHKLELRWNSFHSNPEGINDRILSAQINMESIPNNALNSSHLDYLNHLIAISEQKGIHLIFVLAPRLKKEQYAELAILSSSLAKLNSIQLFQYPQYKELYEIQNSFDIGHLNTKGANILTNHLATEVKRIRKPIDHNK